MYIEHIGTWYIQTYIDYTGVADETAKEFAKVLKSNKILIWLSLSSHVIIIEHNEIGDQGGIAIGEVVAGGESAVLMIDLGYYTYKNRWKQN